MNTTSIAQWVLIISLLFSSVGNFLLVGKMSQLVAEYELASETVQQLKSVRQAEIEAAINRAKVFTAASTARYNNTNDSGGEEDSTEYGDENTLSSSYDETQEQ